jgi:hypothetical protein
MKRPITKAVTIFLFASLTLQSCYQTKIIPKNVMPATEVESKTVVEYFWGLAHEPTITPQDCMGNGITNVKMKTNLGYILISAVTLGIVVPVTVQWQCAKDNCP